jgi:GT2 family glycosyltransferase
LWNELFENLNEGTFIRAPRVDVSYVDIDYNNLSVNGLLNNLPVKWAFMYDGNGLFAAASGDFLCVSKKAVESVKGYDEFFTFSHMDTKILWKLHHSGMVQKVLNNTTFHIDHLRPNCEVASNNSLWTSDFHTHTYNDNWGLFNEVLEVKIYN